VEAIEVLTGAVSLDPPWLIMEWIKTDLGSLTLDERDIPNVLQHVSKGLSYIHSKDFTHRDLKPAKILLILKKPRLLVAKIADFGLLKNVLSRKMQTYTGISIYMAPEFWDELAYTNSVDLWSFGVNAVQKLTNWQTQHEWDSRAPPTKDQHREWVLSTLLPQVAAVP